MARSGHTSAQAAQDVHASWNESTDPGGRNGFNTNKPSRLVSIELATNPAAADTALLRNVFLVVITGLLIRRPGGLSDPPRPDRTC